MKRTIALLMTLVLILLTAAAPGALADTAIVSARTPLDGSSQAKIANIRLCIDRIDGMVVPYGTGFSFNETVGPRTKAYGYQTAKNARGAEVTGGGVAQAATTLYLALLEVNEAYGGVSFDSLKTYSSRFTENYVEDGKYAVITDYSAGTDFAFTNFTDDMTIGMWLTDSFLYCTITMGGQNSFGFDSWYEPSFVSSDQELISSAVIEVEGSDALINNIILAANSINDTILPSGALFSFNDIVGPRKQHYGYQTAPNGRGVDVTGGGVAQVASVVWLAVKHLDCVTVVEKSTYGGRYNQDYVVSSNDAILTDYTAGTDFSFRNTGSAPLTIATALNGNTLICNIYRY